MLEHQNAVSQTQRQRPTAASFTDYDRNCRYRKLGHEGQCGCQSSSNSTLLRFQPWISARRVDEGDHRQTEFRGQSHDSLGLAISLRPGASLVTERLTVASLLPNNHHRLA